MIRSFYRLQKVNPGFFLPTPNEALAFPAGKEVSERRAAPGLLQTTTRQYSRLAGSRSVAAASGLPLGQQRLAEPHSQSMVNQSHRAIRYH